MVVKCRTPRTNNIMMLPDCRTEKSGLNKRRKKRTIQSQCKKSAGLTDRTNYKQKITGLAGLQFTLKKYKPDCRTGLNEQKKEKKKIGLRMLTDHKKPDSRTISGPSTLPGRALNITPRNHIVTLATTTTGTWCLHQGNDK